MFVRGKKLVCRVSIVEANSLRVSKENLAFRLSIVEAVLFELAECSSSGSFVEASDRTRFPLFKVLFRYVILSERHRLFQKLFFKFAKMAGHNQNLVFAQGASINRPPLFTGDNYAFLKVIMEIFMASVDRGIWESVQNEVEKPFFNWTTEENRRAQFDIKVRNIISSVVVLDEFYRISVCKTAHEMWEVLRVTHEGTEDVKRARKNTFIQEYEMFIMQPGETIYDVQKRFTHIVNHLTGLGKTFDSDELNVKILKSLDRSWQPKVTAISESQNLSQMTMPILFGKLREHELELRRLTAEEDQGKRKTLAFKSEISKGKSSKEFEDDDSDDEENMSLMIMKFAKFMKAKGKDKYLKERRENQESPSSVKCYGCGERGHMKIECPKSKKSEEKKEIKFLKKKKAYIAWEDNVDSDEESNICLKADLEDTGSQEPTQSKKSLWYLESGCSRHMTGDKKRFISLEKKKQGFVTYGDNNKGRIMGTGDIGGGNTLTIRDVLYVEGLKYNLLSISQLCDKGLKVTFENDKCTVYFKDSADIALQGVRHNNIYLIDIESASSHSITCLVVKEENPWLWHKRAAHIHMQHLNKLISKDLVIGLPKLKFEKDKLCTSGQVYVSQPPGFEDFKCLDHVYKLKKALYGLKQAPRSWYERLSTFLIDNDFSRDDIIFGSTDDSLCEEFAKITQGEFEMSMMGLQIKQMNGGTFISQKKYCREILKKFGMDTCKEATTPMTTSCYLDKDESGKGVNEIMFRGCVKINCDGAYTRNGKKAAAGGVLRDFDGEFLFAFSSVLRVGSSVEAELFAIKLGMEIGISMGYSNLIVEKKLACRVSIVEANSLRVSKENLAFRLSIVGAVLFELAECSSSGSFVEARFFYQFSFTIFVICETHF
ncbi:hypothetical protein V8G54_010684 [Vigna mungo]|uniref:CCHC-type domain-containing protein n=1 Tax=Vigna mungo TaxID=3915 RepID=A0AAQ3S539_VIGMU